MPLNSNRIGGLIWIVFGAAVVYGSWTMDRLESVGVDPVTAPGLLPGLLGLGFLGFGAALLVRRAGEAEARLPLDRLRLALSFLLCIGFAAGVLGGGTPFWLASGVFVFLHIVLIDDADRPSFKPSLNRIGLAALIAVGSAGATTFIFEKLFLIRLP